MKFISKIFICLFCFSFLFAVAQKSKTDSLFVQLKNTKNDSIKCLLLIELIEEENDNAIWPKYNSELKSIAGKRINTNNSKEKVFFLEMFSDAIVNEGFLLQQNGHLEESINEYRKALDIKFDIGDRKGVANILSNIGYNYDAAADYKKAANYYTKALKIQEELNDKMGASSTLVNLGSMFIVQGDTVKFGEFINKALKYKQLVNDKKGIANCYNSLAIFEEKNSNNEKARELCFKALKIQEEINYKDGMANTYTNLSGLYIRINDFDNATLYADKALELAKDIGDSKGISIASRRHGEISRLKNKLQKTKEWYEQSLKYAKLSGEIHEVKVAAEGLYLVNKDMGLKKEADIMFEFFTKMKDSTERKIVINIDEELTDTIAFDQPIIDEQAIERKDDESELNSFLKLSLLIGGALILIVVFLVLKKRS